MANFNIFSSLVDYQNQLGGASTNTQDFEGFSPGFNLDGVDFLPGIFVTSNFSKVEAFQGSEDTELFALGEISVEEDSFYNINFDESYNAVGFDIDGFDPNTPGPAILEIFFADGDSESIEIFPTNATESDPIFFGVIADTEIENIILTEGPEIDGVGNEEVALDNFIVGNVDNPESNQERTFFPNQIIIRLNDSENSADSTSLQEELGAEVIGTTQTLGIQLWDISDSGFSVEEVVEIYSDDPRIEFIDLNYNDATLFLTPNDPNFSNLWGLNNTGQTGGTIDADIDAPEGWGFVPPEPGVIPTGGDAVVGVLDTGVDYTHPDLNDNIWINTQEFLGLPNVDDDGNGYIDDVRGWDFFNNDNDPMDGHGHGTHVAGTIGAEGDNGIGVVGVNWDVEIMPLKIFSDTGAYAGDFAVIQAIEYANNNNADVTNNSWGTFPLPQGTPPNQGMVNAINDPDNDPLTDDQPLFVRRQAIVQIIMMPIPYIPPALTPTVSFL
ncbi:MAG: S8 family serine peptidase [Okeania sp. SIO3H1]|nr:S8 family serine peptidase [Okeania sp. SIO3H1]